MSDTGLAVHGAIHTALTGALSVSVYDRAPVAAAMPYVVMDSQMAMPDDPLASRRDEVMIYLTVWTKYRGQAQALGIINTIYDTLHQARLTMSAGRMVRAYVVRRMTEPDLDEEIHKGKATVKAIVEH